MSRPIMCHGHMTTVKNIRLQMRVGKTQPESVRSTHAFENRGSLGFVPKSFFLEWIAEV